MPGGAVHAVVNGDKADILFRECDFRVKPYFEIVAPEAGHILDNDRPHKPRLHIGHHLLETGPLKIGPGIAIVGIVADIGESVFAGVPLQKEFLILYAVAFSL